MSVIRCTICKKLAMSGGKRHGPKTRKALKKMGYNIASVCRECVKNALTQAGVPEILTRL